MVERNLRKPSKKDIETAEKYIEGGKRELYRERRVVYSMKHKRTVRIV